MANIERLKELGALAQIMAQFQEPQIQQAELAQQGQQSNRNAMLQALGLVQQRTEAEQRATEAAVRNEIAMKQLGLTERGVATGEAKLPAEIAGMQEGTLASQQKREIAPRLAGIDEEKNRIEWEKTRTAGEAGRNTQLVDLATLLSDPARAGSQDMITAAMQGRPGFEHVGQAVGAAQAAKQKSVEDARALATRAQQQSAQGTAGLASGPAILGGALSPGIGTIRALDQVIGSGVAPQIPMELLNSLTLPASGLQLLGAAGRKKRKSQPTK